MTTPPETVGPCSVCGGTVWWVRVQDYLCARCHPDPAGPLSELAWWPRPGWKRAETSKRLRGVIYDDGGTE